MLEVQAFDQAEVGGRRLSPSVWVGLAWGLALLAGCGLVTLAVSWNGAFLASQMNADILLVPAFVEDVARHGYALTGFQLARIPSFVPDVVLQALARLATPTSRWAVFVACAAQFALLTFTAGWLVRIVTGLPYLWGVTSAFLVLSAVLLLDAFIPGVTGWPFVWLQSSAHGGTYILCLAAAGVVARLMERWKWWLAGALFALTFAALVSDRLVLVSSMAPACAAVLITSWLAERRLSREALAITATIAVAGVAGVLADTLVYREFDAPLAFNGMAGRAASFTRTLADYAPHHLPQVLLGALLPLAIFLAFPLLWTWVSVERDPTPAEAGWTRRLSAFGREFEVAEATLWLTAALAMAAVVSSTALLVFEGDSSFRYLAPVSLWPLIFVAALLVAKRPTRIVVGAGAAIGAAALLAAFAAAPKPPGMVAWRSSVETCLTAQSRAFGLQSGLGEYWVARPVSFSSDQAIQVDELAASGAPRIYGSDAFSFLKRYTTPEQAPVYNFIVMQGLDQEAVRKAFGAPDRRFQCAQANTAVWVYADGPALTRKVLAPLAPPPGSYRRDCDRALLANDDLFAQCRTASGALRYNHLHRVAQCSGDITSVDGRLKASCVRHFGRLRRMLTPPKRKPH